MDMKSPRMHDLFLQLGLESSNEAIANFIRTHQLAADVWLSDAPFWSESQQEFLREQLKADASWVLIIDRLNEALHEDAIKHGVKSL